jgi:hypothetical protein
MTRRRISLTALIALTFVGALFVAGNAAAASSPAWKLILIPLPTNFATGTSGTVGSAPMYRLAATNIGSAPTSGPVTYTATLPAGVVPIGSAGDDQDGADPDPVCTTDEQTVTCTDADPVYPGKLLAAKIPVEVVASSGTLLAEARVEGGGAATVNAVYPTLVSSGSPSFGFLEGAAGLSTLFTNTDSSPSVLAGSHPDQFTIGLAFPTEQVADDVPATGVERPRTMVTDLPRGLVANPGATPVLCTEAELTVEAGCPDASQVGTITVVTEIVGPALATSPLYNMVPPPGVPAMLAFDAVNVHVYVHLKGKLRSDGDYGISADADEILARNPILGVQAHLWGDPSSTSHDKIRGACRTSSSFCPVEPQSTPFLTMPSACSGPLPTAVSASSWENPGVFVKRETQSTDLQGNPVGVNGCSTLEFEPSLTAQPDTNAAETPTGLHVDLKVPQNEEILDEFGNPQQATSTVKDTKVTFPAGVALNPAAADGLGACTSAQIGMTTAVGASPIHFTAERPQCPDSSKIGSVEVKTPLLDHPVPGAVYVAAPYDNPFGTLLGAYVVIDSPDDGIVAKLAGKTEADPVTGQLTTTFTENPQLPFSEFSVDLFGGPRAALRTPSTCGIYETTSEQVPWSGTAPVHTTDSFQINRGANGRPCVSNEAQMPNTPGFEAGTLTPLAANYSPALGRLSREDGTQQLKGLNFTLPPGLTGKLAGMTICPDAALAAADAKTGVAEQGSPSCPPSSELGEVKVGAGAGPSPYYTTGKVYLAGPYKGGPLSAAVITPAVAGPFDLGTVVVRTPAYLDPVTTQLSAKSDPFPQILEGIPLEIRDARVNLNRPETTLNPSSCKEMAITGEAISVLNQIAPLSERFQVGGCRGLEYGPKLSLRLFGGTGRGAHPRLRAILTAKPGEANTARASVALPRSEFLENAHIGTVCTRVQFAADQCPEKSIYGHVKAITPLLDEVLEGPVYLRSSSNELPDLVANLHGPAYRPVEAELVGRIDSINGGIRNTFDFVPDVPVTKFILSMQGGKKGLLVNSRNLCAHTYRATAKFDGQNGKVHDFRPEMKNDCGKKARKSKRQRKPSR